MWKEDDLDVFENRRIMEGRKELRKTHEENDQGMKTCRHDRHEEDDQGITGTTGMPA